MFGNQGPYQPGMPPGVGGFPSPQAQPKKIDPDQMPNPVRWTFLLKILFFLCLMSLLFIYNYDFF